MRPEWSIIILTVFASIAQGVIAFMFVGDLRALAAGTELSRDLLTAGGILTVILAGLGVLSSFFHLHHKVRGAKAILQWKSSWLSREALLLPTFIGAAACYAAAAWFELATELRIYLGLATVIIGFALVIASGMIYATIRFIREWRNAYTPINFVLVGLVSGGVTAIALIEIMGGPVFIALSLTRGMLVMMVVGFVVKYMAYRHNDTAYTASTVSRAIGAGRRESVLMDTGSSYAHYNTKEYRYPLTTDMAAAARWGALGGIYLGPFALLFFDYMPLFRGDMGSLAPIAALLSISGAVAERWLFFTSGNHIQNLYYGTFPRDKIANPITVTGKSTGQLPRR